MIAVNITKRLGDFTLNAAFEAPSGVTAIFGRSGSGKTTLINAIAGLIQPDQGSIRVHGRELVNVPVHKRGLGYVFQDARLFPHLTVGQNLSYGGTHDGARIMSLLGLEPLVSRKPKTLSGGEKSRVALGRALMSNPALLLLDEPLAALDQQRKAEILPYLERLRDEVGVPMIYVSHDMSEVARLANTLVVLGAGQIVRAGPLRDVLADPVVAAQVGPRDAGTVLLGRVARYDATDGLTTLDFDGGSIVLSGQVGTIGGTLRVHVPAQDVILAHKIPVGISARNILPVIVTTIDQSTGVVGLMAGQTPLVARITKASLREMELVVGQNLVAIIKATSVVSQGSQP